jgi:hypothetical protein
MIQAYVRDVALRAAHTFWQTFTASLAVLWAASGLNVSDLVTVSAAHKLAAAVLAAAGASALSTLKSLAAGVAPGIVADADVPAIEPSALEQQVAVLADPQAAAVPADPGQPAAGAPPTAATHETVYGAPAAS